MGSVVYLLLSQCWVVLLSVLLLSSLIMFSWLSLLVSLWIFTSTPQPRRTVSSAMMVPLVATISDLPLRRQKKSLITGGSSIWREAGGVGTKLHAMTEYLKMRCLLMVIWCPQSSGKVPRHL